MPLRKPARPSSVAYIRITSAPLRYTCRSAERQIRLMTNSHKSRRQSVKLLSVKLRRQRHQRTRRRQQPRAGQRAGDLAGRLPRGWARGRARGLGRGRAAEEIRVGADQDSCVGRQAEGGRGAGRAPWRCRSCPWRCMPRGGCCAPSARCLRETAPRPNPEKVFFVFRHAALSETPHRRACKVAGKCECKVAGKCECSATPRRHANCMNRTRRPPSAPRA